MNPNDRNEIGQEMRGLSDRPLDLDLAEEEDEFDAEEANEEAGDGKQFVECGYCWAAILVPPREFALIDENGYYHLTCALCGSENLLPLDFAPGDPGETEKKRLRYAGVPDWTRIVLWVALLALILALMPIIFTKPRHQVEPPREEYEFV